MIGGGRGEVEGGVRALAACLPDTRSGAARVARVMTETLQRPSRPSLPPRRASSSAPAPRRLVVAALLAAAEAAVLGMLVLVLPLLLVWATDPRSGAALEEAVRTGAGLWLLASGAVLQVPGGEVGLTPLGLLALPLLLLARAAARQGRAARLTSTGQAVRLAAAIAGAYAVFAVAVASLASAEPLRAAPVPVAAAAGAVGVTGALLGCLRVDRLWRAAWLRVPPAGRRVLRAVATSSAVLVVAGALLVGGSLAVHGSDAAELARAGDPGPVGGFALLLLGLSLVPNAVVWGVSWLAGPGFAVGVGTAVGPFGAELGPVPAVPLLAALPATGVPTWVGVLVLGAPLAAGALAGLVVQRDLAGAGPWRVVLAALATGPATGLLWLVLAWTSGGAVGGDRLADVGPSPWQVGLALAALVGVGAAPSALLLRRRAVRRTAA
jgi:hypothetical protein